MVYIFTVVSDEADDFVREIMIDSDASFEAFHKIILKSCNYTDDQMTSFFICDEDWEKETEVTLEDMGNSAADEDVYVMRSTRLSELVEEEGQRLLQSFCVTLLSICQEKASDLEVCISKEWLQLQLSSVVQRNNQQLRHIQYILCFQF